MWFVSINLMTSIVHTLIATIFYILYRRYFGFAHIWLARWIVGCLLIGAIVRVVCVSCGAYTGTFEFVMALSELGLVTAAAGMLYRLLVLPAVLGIHPLEANGIYHPTLTSVIINDMPTALAVKSVENRQYVYVNTKFKDAWGTDPIGKTDSELLSFNVAESIIHDDDMLLSSGNQNPACEFFTPNGSILYISRFLIYDDNKQPLYIGMVGLEVNDQKSDVIKNMDRQIQELQAKLQQLCEDNTNASMCRATFAINNLRQLANANKTT